MSIYVNYVEDCLTTYICIKLVLPSFGTYGYAVSLQARSSILVVVPFRVYYIISLPTKYVLVVISSNSIIISSRNTSCCWSVTNWEKCEESAKSAKGVKKECDRMHTLILK